MKRKKIEMVITNCRDCSWRRYLVNSHVCTHSRVTLKDEYEILDGIHPIPDWCPLDDFINEDIVEPGC